MMAKEITQPVEKSKFNASLAKLERMDKLKQTAHLSRLYGDYETWFHCLMGLRSEIWERLDTEETKEMDKLDDIFKAWQKYNDDRYKNNKMGAQKVNMQFYWKLDQLERSISKLERKYGLSLIDIERESLLDID